MNARALLLTCALACAPAAPLGATPLPPAAVTLGDEVFLQNAARDLGGRCIGIVTNQTGVTAELESIVDAVRRDKSICVKALYAPEHGLRGDQSAGKYVASYIDDRTGLPVGSLYGATRHPTESMLGGVDVLVFDIQDVGSRAYTYISTLAYVMQAAHDFNKEVWVLDRPNPAGADIVEGPVLDPAFKSFVGLYPIAFRHGMTIGELARMFNGEFGINCKLRVIGMKGYRRSMQWPDTGLAWIPTSPNIPEWDTTLVYPATGLIDKAGINNGAGYMKPFKLAGSFGMDGQKYADTLNARNIPGITFFPTAWSPVAGFWKDRTLTGVQLIVTDTRTFHSVRTAVELLAAARTVMPGKLSYPADMDRDWGTDKVRLALQRGDSADSIVHSWSSDLKAFMAIRAKYLLY